jgi:type IV secretion system protein VirB11
MTTPLLQLQYLMQPFYPLLEGGTEDIAVNEPGVAWVRRGGRWEDHTVPTLDYGTLLDMSTLAAAVSEQITNARHPLLFTDIPMVDGPPLRLMSIQWPAIEPGKIAWTLRQPGDRIYTVDEVTARYKTERWNRWQRRKESRNHDQALALFDAGDLPGFLTHIVVARYNILLCGPTGSGKTTAGSTLIDAIPLNERIITLENAREYRMRHPNRLHLLYSQGGQGLADVTQKDLQTATLRSRPDRVLVQELLDPEAAETYVSEIVSGHPGSITTIHGLGAAQAFKRLFTMIKSSVAGAAQHDNTVISTLASAIDVIIPFHNEGEVFTIGEVFFAPDAARRNETVGDLLKEIA